MSTVPVHFWSGGSRVSGGVEVETLLPRRVPRPGARQRLGADAEVDEDVADRGGLGDGRDGGLPSSDWRIERELVLPDAMLGELRAMRAEFDRPTSWLVARAYEIARPWLVDR